MKNLFINFINKYFILFKKFYINRKSELTKNK